MRDSVTGQAKRFAVIGMANSLFGYFFGVGCYTLFSGSFNLLAIGFFVGFVSIVFSFWSQRILVFKSSDPWLTQLRRSFAVYGVISVFGAGFLWYLIEVFSCSIWIAQAIVIFVSAALSYFGQRFFTFRISSKPGRSVGER